MCGIIGLFLKDPALEPELGAMMAGMLGQMTERGPDSAGFAVYDARGGEARLTVRAEEPVAFEGLDDALGEALGAPVSMTLRATHAVLSVPEARAGEARAALKSLRPGLDVMSWGAAIEIYKEVGAPGDVSVRFGLDGMRGTHGVGHTRMATESAVTTMGAHPFSTGADQCLVHNGSLSNHNALRRELVREGREFETENDSEVAAAYLTARMEEGAGLGEALEMGLKDLDGFYTFVVGTRDGFGVLRDPVACKPAVMAETERYVAFGSEYRALADLPGIEAARVWEPEPATVYFWSR
ncbi:MAG: glutamine amidotransferase family protein [Pseudomonadota bacterium]